MTAEAAPLPAEWIALSEGDPFGLQTLPYGVFDAGDGSRVGVRVGDRVLDLGAAYRVLGSPDERLFADGSLDLLLGAGVAAWTRVRADLQAWLSRTDHRNVLEPLLLPLESVVMQLPFTVADYVDFYASEHHATNLGRMFRPDQEPLTPNWKHLPIGYHGRAGTVVVSGEPVLRPRGQLRRADGQIVVELSARLDIEAEIGFVVGTPTARGQAVPLEAFTEHVFGICLVNDWSARDIQAWEYVPLGPFLGKSFHTSISPWIVPLAALDTARVAPPARDPRPAEYLDDSSGSPWGLDVRLDVALNGHVISRPPFASMYWTGAQMLAHMTINGASLRTGDLFASGTVSGPLPEQRGSLIELTWAGSEPLTLPDGSVRTFLENEDEVVITATAPGPGGTVVGLGEVRGRITAG
ncbi:fumarylacetoacetase [Nonomuraea basaltis]|uniref:fumarylacetoacetase n=1 Tax=Nonomuraea basaltis TaxID=2495887 RepID=UPI00110C6C65|nr:fumarylacetoacetase [Nonomuraea basaltis]TMR97702.1 fumarylacetoacetase [Nonomuraea basaltis]